MVEPPFERQRDIFGEKDLRPSAERHPFVPTVLRIPVFVALVDEDGHDGKAVIGLVEQLLDNQKPRRAPEKRRRIVKYRAEVAGRSGPVLDGKCVVASVPLQALMAHPKGVSRSRRDRCPRRRLPALRGSVVEPDAPQTKGSFQVIEPHIDVALAEISVSRNNVGPRSGNERHG